MMKIEEELESSKEKLNEIINRINELKENSIIKEYISLLDSYDLTKNKMKGLEISKKEQEMCNCEHMFIILPRDKYNEYLLPDEVVLYCLKCGVTNGIHYHDNELYPTDNKMMQIVHSTNHHGRIIFDREVTDLEYAKKKYQELSSLNMTKEDLSLALRDLLFAREVKKGNITKV